MLVHIFSLKNIHIAYTYIYITEKMCNLNTTCQSLGFIIMALWQCAPSVPTAWIMATKPIWSDNLEHDTVLYKIIVFTKLARDEKKKFCDAPKSEGTKTDSGKLCTLYLALFVTIIMIMTSSHCTFIIINLDFYTFLLLYRYCALLH